MPLLLMRNFPGTLLDQSCRASVRAPDRIRAAERGVPWGISESAYAFTDRAGNYQYHAFGVPGPRIEARPLRRSGHRPVRDGARGARRSGRRRARTSGGSARQGLDGRFGFYEALDYQPRARRCRRRRPKSRRAPAIVRAFFAHHQGMSLVAIANVLCDDAFVDPLSRRSARAGHASCFCRSGCRARRSCRSRVRPRARPRRHPLRVSRRGASARRTRRARTRSSCRTAATPRRSPTPAAVTARGAAWRSRASATIDTSDAGAHYIFLRDPWSGHVWSPTYQPVCHEPDNYDVTFDLDKVTFRARNGDFETQLQVTVSSEDDVEVRRLSIINRGDRAARDRGHQLRGDRAGASRGRLRASGVRQAVHRDRVRCAERRPAVQPAAARR